jgi:hypothetical protein
VPGNIISPAGRRFAAMIAIIGCCALIAQLIVTMNLVTADGRSIMAGLWLYLGYFTILTNILVAGTMAWVARGKPASASFLGGIALAISVVGIVYHLLLKGRMPDIGWLWWLADRSLHYVVPTLAATFWAFFAPKSSLGFRDALMWLRYPVAYLATGLLAVGGIKVVLPRAG